MTSRTPRATFERSRARLLGEVPEDERRDGTIYGDDLPAEDRQLIETFIRAHDPADPTVPTAGEKSANTLARYIANLIRVAERERLATADADALNRVCADLVGEGRSEATVRQTQMTLRSFYRFSDLGVAPESINTFGRPSSSFDDRDMLTRDEIDAIEDALDHPRDLAIWHLLLYTGQRVGSLRTLRVKDVDPSAGTTGRWHFNTTAAGLKDVYKPRAPRPLFGAKAAVRDWLKYHPTGEADAYFITAKPQYNSVDASEPVTGELFRKLLSVAKESAGVEKPLHTHMVRHNAVTIWKRDYDVPDETVKFYLGHSPRSTIMETTYSHLSAEDHAERGEQAMGYADEGEDRLGRETCPICDNPLRPGARACDRCAATLTPDGEATVAQGGASGLLQSALVDGDDAALKSLAEALAPHLPPEQVASIAEANAAGQPPDG